MPKGKIEKNKKSASKVKDNSDDEINDENNEEVNDDDLEAADQENNSDVNEDIDEDNGQADDEDDPPTNKTKVKAKKAALAPSGANGTKAKHAKDTDDDAESGSTSKPKLPIYRLKQINFDNVDLSPLNKAKGQQPISYINYQDPVLNAETKLLFQARKIKLKYHGIPRLNEEDPRFDSDEKRDYIKVPIDPEQDNCVELGEMLTAADAYFGSEDVKTKLFGKNAAKYEYQPCRKTPQPKEDDDEDDTKTKKAKAHSDDKPRPIIDYCKFKFDTMKKGTGKNVTKINKTKLVRIEGKRRIPVQAVTITDIANEITYQSDITFIGYFSKVWANEQPLPGSKKRMYGVGLKMMAVEYVRAISKSIKSEDLELLPEEDEDDEPVAASKKGKTNPTKKPAKAAKLDSDEEGADEAADDEAADDDIPVGNSKKGKKKGKKAAVVEDDEDEAANDEVVDDEAAEDDAEDEIPVKSSKKKAKSSKKDR